MVARIRGLNHGEQQRTELLWAGSAIHFRRSQHILFREFLLCLLARGDCYINSAIVYCCRCMLYTYIHQCTMIIIDCRIWTNRPRNISVGCWNGLLYCYWHPVCLGRCPVAYQRLRHLLDLCSRCAGRTGEVVGLAADREH